MTRRARTGHRRSHARRLALARAAGLLAVLCLVVGGAVAAQRALAGRLPPAKRSVVKAVEVSGSQRASEAEVLRAAGLAAGMSLTDVDPARVKAALARCMPWLERVAVSRGRDGTVALDLRERRPVALVNLGRVYQMDDAGVLFDLPADGYIDLPVVCGVTDTIGKGLPRQLRQRSLERFRAFRRAVLQDDGAWMQRIAQIDFGRKRSVRFTLEGCPAPVEVGCDDVTRKMEQLRRLLALLEQERKPPRSINLRYPNMAYVAR